MQPQLQVFPSLVISRESRRSIFQDLPLKHRTFVLVAIRVPEGKFDEQRLLFQPAWLESRLLYDSKAVHNPVGRN